MSLVSEALRKARREAAERGENLDGRTTQTTVIQVTRGPRTWQVIALGTVVAVSAAVLGAVAVWWMLGATSDPDVVDLGDRPAVAVPPLPTTSPTTTPEDAPDDAASASLRPQAAAAPTPRRQLLPPTPRPTAPAPTDATSAVSERVAGDESSEPAPAATAPTPSPATEPTALGPNEFLGEAVVDGRRLVLDYIAYLPTGSFAEINGIEVRLGSRVEGFTVESITATAVRLRGPDGPVVLRAR